MADIFISRSNKGDRVRCCSAASASGESGRAGSCSTTSTTSERATRAGAPARGAEEEELPGGPALLSRDWLGPPWCDSDIPDSRAVAISPHTGASQIHPRFYSSTPWSSSHRPSLSGWPTILAAPPQSWFRNCQEALASYFHALARICSVLRQ